MSTSILVISALSLIANIATLVFVVRELRARKIKAVNQKAVELRIAKFQRAMKDKEAA